MARFDPAALLCENCGYHLAGLSRETNCPECGKPVSESLPENRVGTPWQRRPGLGSWLRTAALPVREPRGMWDRVSVGSVHTISFLFITLLLASMPLAGVLFVFIGDVSTLRKLYAVGLVTGGIVGVLLIAVKIEMLGIRIFGRNHGWRITDDVALGVCAHAAPGWFIGSVAIVGVVLIDGVVRLPRWLFPEALVLSAAFLGLLAFETLVYIGMRRMRFANRPEASLWPSSRGSAEGTGESNGTAGV